MARRAVLAPELQALRQLVLQRLGAEFLTGCRPAFTLTPQGPVLRVYDLTIRQDQDGELVATRTSSGHPERAVVGAEGDFTWEDVTAGESAGALP